MEFKTLVWFIILMALSASILSNPEAISSTRSQDLKQADESHCRKSLVTHGNGERKACSTKVQSVHAEEVQILNEYGNRVLPFHSKKRSYWKVEGRNLAGHSAHGSSKKNLASSLYRPSSFIIFAYPCIALVFTVFLLPL